MKKKTGLDEVKRQVETILSCADGTEINVCYALYKSIRGCSAAMQARLLQFVAESYDEAESNKSV